MNPEQLLPPGSIERARDQLRRDELIKAIKTCRRGNHDLSVLAAEFEACVRNFFSRRDYGNILSAYHLADEQLGPYTVADLLRAMWKVGDVSGFLNQAYRFRALDGFEDEIEEAIRVHESKGFLDAAAWRRKFAELKEGRESNE